MSQAAKRNRLIELSILIYAELQKNLYVPEYELTDDFFDSEEKIMNISLDELGYDWEYDDDAHQYFAKATQAEIWKYWIDIIIPKLHKEMGNEIQP